ncbi:MAG: flavodoxin family protein [Clostridiales bacterium]|nr:flavodoxin family protein [Clostridiales bacterium]
MKTLIFNGSPRKNGNTAALIQALSERLGGEIKVVRAYDCDVRPCIDCRYCWKNRGCSIKDGMQEIYKDIDEADNIVIASPVNFSELTGQLLAVLSRLQTYWCAKYLRKEEPVSKPKRAGVILVRGGSGPQKLNAIDTAKMILGDISATVCGVVVAENSDAVPSVQQEGVLEAIYALADALKQG